MGVAWAAVGVSAASLSFLGVGGWPIGPSAGRGMGGCTCFGEGMRACLLAAPCCCSLAFGGALRLAGCLLCLRLADLGGLPPWAGGAGWSASTGWK
eukprot:12036574-Alexandrium_andersonii.AAC.1